jgi:hypothetical protein
MALACPRLACPRLAWQRFAGDQPLAYSLATP